MLAHFAKYVRLLPHILIMKNQMCVQNKHPRNLTLHELNTSVISSVIRMKINLKITLCFISISAEGICKM